MTDKPRVFDVVGTFKGWQGRQQDYGYVVPIPPNLPDILLHHTAVHAGGWLQAHIKEGDILEVQALERPRGLQVFRVLTVNYRSYSDHEKLIDR